MNPFEKKEKPVTESAVQLQEKETRTVVLDHENAYLADVIKSQPSSLEEIEIKLSEKADPNQHQLTLPPEIKKYENKYTFRWIMKNRRSISLASQVRKLMFVNKTYFPDLPDHLFTASGAIERGDSILVFTLREVSERRKQELSNFAKEKVQSKIGAHKSNPNFYTPTDEDGETTKVVGI